VAWRKYLRREYPTIMFKANTQGQGEKLADIELQPGKLPEKLDLLEKLSATNKAVGGANLMQLIKNYCRSGNVKTSITVGVIGFPNVGKSSVINSLKRSKVAAVSSVPGYTKTIQEIHLDHNVRLLDCPGVVLAPDNADSLMLRNVMKVEDLTDVFSPVDVLVKKVAKTTLLQAYDIPDFTCTQDFLAAVARKRGRLLKGGTPDIDQTARLVLRDWNTGKLAFFTPCPDPSLTSSVSSVLFKRSLGPGSRTHASRLTWSRVCPD
jgi:nuclear GTP-binding protein